MNKELTIENRRRIFEIRNMMVGGYYPISHQICPISHLFWAENIQTRTFFDQIRTNSFFYARLRWPLFSHVGEFRLGQLHSADYCVPPYTIRVSITLG